MAHMINFMLRIVFIIVVLVLPFLFIRYLEKKTLYYPEQTIEATPKDITLNYEEVAIVTKDSIQISGWFIPSANARATIIFSHGNAGNISHRLEKIMAFNKLNLNVLIFDYRGYGKSKGSPSEKGLYLDAEAVYSYLINKKRIPQEKIIAYGESLGGAVVIDLASRHSLGGIITEGCFTSVKDMAKKIFPFIPTFIYSSKYNSLEKIKNIKSPKLIFHSIDDEIVPFEQGRKLFGAASEPKEFAELKGGHNEAFFISHGIFIEKIEGFVRRMQR